MSDENADRPQDDISLDSARIAAIRAMVDACAACYPKGGAARPDLSVAHPTASERQRRKAVRRKCN